MAPRSPPQSVANQRIPARKNSPKPPLHWHAGDGLGSASGPICADRPSTVPCPAPSPPNCPSSPTTPPRVGRRIRANRAVAESSEGFHRLPADLPIRVIQKHGQTGQQKSNCRCRGQFPQCPCSEPGVGLAPGHKACGGHVQSLPTPTNRHPTAWSSHCQCPSNCRCPPSTRSWPLPTACRYWPPKRRLAVVRHLAAASGTRLDTPVENQRHKEALLGNTCSWPAVSIAPPTICSCWRRERESS